MTHGINGLVRMQQPGAKERFVAMGKHEHSTEERLKRSASLKGRPRPPEVCQKISASKKGKPKSAEHRLKLGWGRIQTSTARAKRSESLKKFNAARRLSLALEAM